MIGRETVTEKKRGEELSSGRLVGWDWRVGYDGRRCPSGFMRLFIFFPLYSVSLVIGTGASLVNPIQSMKKRKEREECISYQNGRSAPLLVYMHTYIHTYMFKAFRFILFI